MEIAKFSHRRAKRRKAVKYMPWFAITEAVIRYKKGPALRYKKGPSIWYIGPNLRDFF